MEQKEPLPEEGEITGVQQSKECILQMEQLSHYPMCDGCGEGFQG